MPFGLCNAPATFCRLMKQVLADIVWSKCLVYLDDIMAFGSNFKRAYENLEVVFKRLIATNLKLKPQKCELFWDKLDYLGHEVSHEGIHPSHAKIAGLHDNYIRAEDVFRVHILLQALRRVIQQSPEEGFRMDWQAGAPKRCDGRVRRIKGRSDTWLSVEIHSSTHRFLAGCRRKSNSNRCLFAAVPSSRIVHAGLLFKNSVHFTLELLYHQARDVGMYIRHGILPGLYQRTYDRDPNRSHHSLIADWIQG